MRSLRRATCTSGEPVSSVVSLVRADDFGLAIFGKRHVASSTNGPERRQSRCRTGSAVALIAVIVKRFNILHQDDDGMQKPGWAPGRDPEQPAGLVAETPSRRLRACPRRPAPPRRGPPARRRCRGSRGAPRARSGRPPAAAAAAGRAARATRPPRPLRPRSRPARTASASPNVPTGCGAAPRGAPRSRAVARDRGPATGRRSRPSTRPQRRQSRLGQDERAPGGWP